MTRRPARGVPLLVVALECDRPASSAARYSLERVECVTLGRGAPRGAVRREDHGATLLGVHVPAGAMSTAHARLLRAGGDWVIEDVGSTNGTYVNGTRTARAVVGERDVITLGRTHFLLVPSRMIPTDAPDDVDAATLVQQGGHITLDPELDAALSALARVARSEIPVLVRGETGSGKELLARSVHEASGRTGAFIAVNCGAIPAGLVESHLFGHLKGAFSGALRDEPGVFRAAEGGTLFLDEIGDLPLPSQVALLRALQEREVVPVGATRATKVDLRVVAATHQPLEAMAASGAFRRDLLARLSGFSLELPPLRARRMDLGILVAALLKKLAPAHTDAIRFSPAAGEALLRYDWPLNVRELEQCLARALVLAGDASIGVRAGSTPALSPFVSIDVSHLPAPVVEAGGASSRATAADSGLSERDAKLRLALLEELARHDGNLKEVASAMGKARMQVHRWCKRFGIDPNLYRR